MNNKNIIIVDDEVNICRSMKACLTPEGYTVVSFTEPSSALKSMHDELYDAAIIDIRLGKQSGIKLFEQMCNDKINIPVIFISGNASLDEAVQSLKLGAYDFLEKPFSADKLINTLKNCIEFYHLRSRVKVLEGSQQHDMLFGDHKLMKILRNDICKVAQSEAAVLIAGESGTGKELIAHSIHQQSHRSKNLLVKVNCSAIPENLIDSALFGHVKGAFTGAEQHKKGFFEMADKSTLFLDEIGDMPMSSQASLLRVLESKEIQKVGSEKVTKVDVRILAASHKDLKEQIKLGLFREDLYYRINVIPIVSPALRDRRSDIPLLVNYFINLLCKRNGVAQKSIDTNCYPIMCQYDWPGNVRELLNIVERMLIMGDQKITLSDLPDEITNKKNNVYIDDEVSLKEFRIMMERELLIKKLKFFNGNITQVAKSLAVDRSYLHKKLNQYEIKRNHNFD
ncbi:sigma-54-dependent transcriptional regulator [Pseudoalteromonas denitrificans]|uniref:Two-component system, NtrC family, nitrogen regulation response regulator NtrX n=1 Tax=Pseudoalteromonas denitrificans DSM 6059 TaxID=1123010 RepID=A0A1I1FQ05_9GAMM|nr:sigma-54 dependent transcriptional regulator [Pseudoalteromonas denitrificans]SFC01425.1 two-component system, NtrC family, nitrogen regulation response regulator NtrX [Pseudoalteromonas denitrificans DSM 6059]